MPRRRLQNCSAARAESREALARRSLLLAGLLGTACSKDADDTRAVNGISPAESQTRAALYACEEHSFVERRPLMGPGFDRARGGLLDEPRPSYLVFASQAYPKPEQRELFGNFAQAISAQIDSSPGALAHAIGTDATCGVGRTLSIWVDEAALFEFATTGAHAEAMARGREYFLSFKTTYWSATVQEIRSLDWDTARPMLDAEAPVWYEPPPG